ncbi:hypothetical protein HanXRQr2_Chr13g0596591 [Helianthus annuus]|uniref:Uncharacterized protein n=1 Tax=Helianthus annuus TaxID=4232 RepID=A0A9K3HCL0_HELAN|nr:hypothetical protein HanXRQr2_Chr13g0596591 [Helianthus annuus]KAJ0849924.1 hypothetical protein HanPSC8_Chr13g0574561 [Helianthus annuus]
MNILTNCLKTQDLWNDYTKVWIRRNREKATKMTQTRRENDVFCIELRGFKTLT